MNQATKQAVKTAGGMKALGAELSISYQAVQKWLKSGIPAGRVLEVESLTGVSRYRLRPDIFGQRPDAAA